MSDTKFDPVKEFISLRDNISKAVGQTIKSATAMPFPAVDIYETDGEVVICTQPLGGIVSSSIEVSMEGDVLTITGTTQSIIDVPDQAFIQRELRFGTFSRVLQIPRKVRPNEAAASLKMGVLTITLPRESADDDQIVGVTPAE
jgi:HSP20 family protein